MLSYMLQIMGFATEIMCRSYEANTERSHEVKHSYRLFSAMQDVAVQKDKQRSILLDWENRVDVQSLLRASAVATHCFV